MVEWRYTLVGIACTAVVLGIVALGLRATSADEVPGLDRWTSRCARQGMVLDRVNLRPGAVEVQCVPPPVPSSCAWPR